ENDDIIVFQNVQTCRELSSHAVGRNVPDLNARLGCHRLSEPAAIVVEVRLLDHVRADEVTIQHDFRVAYIKDLNCLHKSPATTNIPTQTNKAANRVLAAGLFLHSH